MKKKYESPIAEKYEFDYLENVVASGLVTEDPTNNTPSAKNGMNNPGCFKGNSSAARGCTPKDNI